MDRHLRPAVLSTDPNSPDALKSWRHWKRTFDYFIETLNNANPTPPNKLAALINFVDPSIYEIIAECTDYDSAITTLTNVYDKPKNEVFARHLLSTCKQESGQSLDQFLQKLKVLSKDCNYKSVSAVTCRDEAIRDAFISGLLSTNIRQRLLENENADLTLDKAFDKARSLDMAEKQSQSYTINHPLTAATKTLNKLDLDKEETDQSGTVAAGISEQKCYFCGYKRHPRSKCPARDASCKRCNKLGHFAKVCKSGGSKTLGAVQEDEKNSLLFASSSAASGTKSLSKAKVSVCINNTDLSALIDTGSTDSYIDYELAKRLGLKIRVSSTTINMASMSLTGDTQGHCFVNLIYQNRKYHQKLLVLTDLCSDIILGHDFQNLHKEVCFPFEGELPPLTVCGVTAANIEPPSLFNNLSPDTKPIAVKSRRYPADDELFIQNEVKKLLADGVIERSSSPWRAQVLVTTGDKHKKRLVIDYSQTINKYTQLDAYPLPRLDKMAENISQFKYYSTLDLKSAYHQIPIKDSDKQYTAFEACGNLFHFKRIPFGVTNGVAIFQRTIDNLIKSEELQCVFAYVDNVTVCGNSKEEHDVNLKKVTDAFLKHGFTFNEDKSTICVNEIDLLGYRLSHGKIRPDPERLAPLHQMAPPNSLKAQKRACGMFAYYSPWLSHFSDKIRILSDNCTFPLPSNVLSAFESLREEHSI